jgi:predicted alpha/beta superfamily hydrolase
MIMKKFVFTLFLSLFSNNCFAQKVLQVNKYITSKENGVDYKLYISLPEGYHDKDNFSYRKTYPVLYALDGDTEFAVLKNIADTMVNFGTIEPMIIVGIGYKGQELSPNNSKTFWNNYMLYRTRDYIPSELTKDVDNYLQHL